MLKYTFVRNIPQSCLSEPRTRNSCWGEFNSFAANSGCKPADLRRHELAVRKGYATNSRQYTDAIQLCEHFEFETEEIEDLFSLITDPDVNGKIDKEVVKQLLNGL